jgi:hypothetical protein
VRQQAARQHERLVLLPLRLQLLRPAVAVAARCDGVICADGWQHRDRSRRQASQ